MMPPSWKTEIEETVEKAAHSSNERQKTNNDKNASEIASGIKSLHNTYQTQSNKSEKADKVKRAIDIATVVLLFFTALFTGLAWWVFRGQLSALQTTDDAIHRQLTLAENDQRPWLKAQFEILKPLSFDTNGLQLELSGKTLNVGKLPAFNAELHPFIVTITAGIDLAKTQKEFCENVIKNVRKDRPGGTIIFPGDHIINSPITRGFSPEEIERGKTMLGFNPPDFKRDFLGIVLTGCIIYAFPGQKDSKARMTGFGYQFHTSKSFGIDTTKGTIPVNEMEWFVVPELTWAD